MRWMAINLRAYNVSKILPSELYAASKSLSNTKMPQVKLRKCRNFSFENKDITLALYISLVTPHLEYAVKFWLPHQTKDMAKLETV